MAAATTSAFLDTSCATARVSSSLRRARVSSRVASFDLRTRRRSPHVVICHSESGGGCCGGSGSSSSGSTSSSSSSSGGCGSHGKKSLGNLGKEFEHLVATNTLLEFEKDYNLKPMEGKITREIMNNVMDTIPEGSATTEGEKFLDINEILAEAKSMSNGDFVFSEDPEFVLV